MKIKEFLDKYFDVIETFFLLGFACGMIMLVKQIVYAFWVLKISLGALAVLYWSKAIDRNKEQQLKEKISEKMLWYSLLLTPVAVISKLQFSDNANKFLIFAMVALLFALIFRLYERKSSKQKIIIGEIIRLLVALLLAFYLYSLPLPSIN